MRRVGLEFVWGVGGMGLDWMARNLLWVRGCHSFCVGVFVISHLWDGCFRFGERASKQLFLVFVLGGLLNQKLNFPILKMWTQWLVRT